MIWRYDFVFLDFYVLFIMDWVFVDSKKILMARTTSPKYVCKTENIRIREDLTDWINDHDRACTKRGSNEGNKLM